MAHFMIMAVFSLYCTPVEEPSLLSTFKNKLCVPQRLSFCFKQVPFQLMQTRLRYQRAKNEDGRTDGFSALYSRYGLLVLVYSQWHVLFVCNRLIYMSHDQPLS